MQPATCPHRPPARRGTPDGAPGIVTGPGPAACPEPRSGAGDAYRYYFEAEARPAAVPAARRAVRQALAAWGLGHVADDAGLVLSELLANAVAATQAAAPAGQMVAAYLALDLDRLFVLAWDPSPDLPVRRGPAGDAETGRGLEIVSAIADQWGTVTPAAGGKVVWARLGVTRREAGS